MSRPRAGDHAAVGRLPAANTIYDHHTTKCGTALALSRNMLGFAVYPAVHRIQSLTVCAWIAANMPQCRRTRAFATADHRIVGALMRRGPRRHATKSAAWITGKYWRGVRRRRTFVAAYGPVLQRHGQTVYRRHVKVLGDASPYSGDVPY